MNSRPRIGITPTPSTAHFDHGDFYRYCLSDTYVKSVWQAGGAPMIVPWVGDEPAATLDAIDGLILSGGGDIDPARFHQERHGETGGLDEGRDAFETALMREAAARDFPTLAICRGIQVMCVAFGGSLHQHVPDVTPGDVVHAQHKAGYTQHEPSHRVIMEHLPNPVSELLGKDELMVNSFHHQSLDSVPAPLHIAGRADDGTVEAIWHSGMSFGIGVQWHPEMLALRHEDHARFFTGLVAASRKPVPAAD